MHDRETNRIRPFQTPLGDGKDLPKTRLVNLQETQAKNREYYKENRRTLEGLKTYLLEIPTLSPFETAAELVDAVVEAMLTAEKNGSLTPVSIFQGPPGSGKDFMSKLVADAIAHRRKEFKDFSRSPLFIHWDSIEKYLRKEGIITTPPTEPFTSEELIATRNRLVQEVKAAVLSRKHSVVICSVPYGTGVALNTQLDHPVLLEAKEYGNNFLADLLIELNKGLETPEQLPEIFSTHMIFGVSLLLHMYLRHALIYLAESFEEANEYRKIFGVPGFEHPALWQLYRKTGGGSVEQVESALVNALSLLHLLTAQSFGDEITWNIFEKTMKVVSELGANSVADLYPLLPIVSPVSFPEDLCKEITESPLATILGVPTDALLTLQLQFLQLAHTAICTLPSEELRKAVNTTFILNNPSIDLPDISVAQRVIAQCSDELTALF